MPHTRPIVVGIGEILWDLLPAGKQLGGAVTNFAYHAQSLGARGIVASCIGADALGQEIRHRLESLAMDRSYLALDEKHPTGTVDVQVDGHGVPTFTICRDVAWDFIPTTPRLLKLAAEADAVCFGSLAQRSPVSRQTIHDFLSATRPNCLRIFDINIRQQFYSIDVIDQSLRLSAVLKLNDQELPILAGLLSLDSGEESAMHKLMQRYPLKLIALTLGAAGSRLYTQSNVYKHPGRPAQVVDTVGAGDAFTAALAMGLLKGDDPAAINDRANRLASFVCSQPGATPKVPSDF